MEEKPCQAKNVTENKQYSDRPAECLLKDSESGDEISEDFCTKSLRAALSNTKTFWSLV